MDHLAISFPSPPRAARYCWPEIAVNEMVVSLGSSHRQNRIRRASDLNSLTRWLWLQQARTATTGARHWHFVVSERLQNVEFMYLKI